MSVSSSLVVMSWRSWSSDSWRPSEWSQSSHSWQQDDTWDSTSYDYQKSWYSDKRIAQHQEAPVTPKKARAELPVRDDWSCSPTGKPWSMPPGQPEPPSFPPQAWVKAPGFHDTNYVARRQLPDQIQSTAWSRKAGLAGLDPLSIPLSSICFKGQENASFRWLAHGEFTSVVFGRNIKETVLAEKVLQKVRALHVDLDVLANHMFVAEFKHSPNTSTPEKKGEMMDYLASKMVQTLQCNMTPELIRQAQTIQALEQQAMQQSIVPVSANAVHNLPSAPAAAAADSTSDPFLAALQVDFDTPSARPLKKTSPAKSNPAAVNSWIQKLALDESKKTSLAEAVERITARTLSKEIKKNLKDRAAEYGLTQELLANMKDPELVKCVLAAVALSS